MGSGTDDNAAAAAVASAAEDRVQRENTPGDTAPRDQLLKVLKLEAFGPDDVLAWPHVECLHLLVGCAALRHGSGGWISLLATVTPSLPINRQRLLAARGGPRPSDGGQTHLEIPRRKPNGAHC